MPLSRIYVAVTCILLFVGTACSPTDVNDAADSQQAVPESPGNVVNAELAQYAAGKFANSYNFKLANLMRGKTVQSEKSMSTSVKHILPRKDANGDTFAYFINYEEQGFAVVSADKRMQPILAFSKKGGLPATAEEPLPGGLRIWLNDIARGMEDLQEAKQKDSGEEHQGWSTITSPTPNMIEEPDPGDPGGGCEDEFIEKGPLLQTKWGQDEGYNNFAPDYNCSSTSNGRAPARLRGYSYGTGNAVPYIS
ncbi:MAG: Spi family protease inhibitor [Fodinibius sp.]|nr:Spi family protease inhibitor [Fodinibius sp.]